MDCASCQQRINGKSRWEEGFGTVHLDCPPPRITNHFPGAHSITANYPGECEKCHYPFSAGERILWKPDHVEHERCPLIRRLFHPVTMQEALGHG